MTDPVDVGKKIGNGVKSIANGEKVLVTGIKHRHWGKKYIQLMPVLMIH